MLNALRLKHGFPETQFEDRTGVLRQSVQSGFDLAIERGLLESRSGTGWRPTDLGYWFLNDLQAIFLSLEGE